MSKIHFITFYTRGYEIDGIGCQDLRECEQVLKSKVGPQVDEYQAYSYGEVKELCEEAVHNFYYFFMPNEHSGFMGFFRWKAFIISYHLKQMKDDDILVYRDVNHVKYPAYREGLDEIRENVEWILKKLPIPLFVPIERENCHLRNYVKRGAFRQMGVAFEEVKNLPLLYTTFMAMRKTPFICEIMHEWWRCCLLPGIVEPIHEGPREEGFRHHTCANAVLNLVLRKYQLEDKLPVDQFRYYLMERKFIRDSIREYYPEKERPDGKWRIINKSQFQSIIPYYSENMVYYKKGNEWLIYLLGKGHFKWIGFEHSSPGKYRVVFDILFKDYVPEVTNNVGFKTHHPQPRIHNAWLNEVVVNEWRHVEIAYQKIDTKPELMILIFDDCELPNEVRVRNFEIRR